MDAIMLLVGVGIGMIMGGVVLFGMDCWDKYQTRKLNREWRI